MKHSPFSSPALPSFLALAGIVLFAWLVRAHRLGEPAGFVFDESYHVPAIRLIAESDPRAFEWWHPPLYGADNHDWLHPPLAKYIQAGFWQAFGQDAFAWRLASAVFGTAGILLVFVVAQRAFQKPALSLLAALLLALDGAWLVQSRIAMNDIFVSVWLLVATAVFLGVQRSGRLRPLLWVGILVGLGLATKWSAILWLIALLVWKSVEVVRNQQVRQLPWVVFTLFIVPIALYALAYLPVVAQGKSWAYVMELHQQIVRYHWLGAGFHPAQSETWQWVLNLKPVWYWRGGPEENIFIFNNPLLAWLEVGALITSAAALWRRSIQNVNFAFFVMLFGMMLFPLALSPRGLFYYHFTPLTPVSALLLAYWLHRLYIQRATSAAKLILFFVLTSLVWVFWLAYPLWTGLPTSPTLSQLVLSIFPTPYWML